MANDVVKALITNSYLEDIADAIREKGGASSELLPSEMADGISNIPSVGNYQEKVVSPTDETVVVLPDDGYSGLTRVTVTAVEMQEKSVNPTTSAQTVEPDSDKTGLSRVNVSAVALQTKSVNPTTSVQTITPDEGYIGLSSVEVGAKDTFTTQEKTAISTGVEQEIVPDSGYDGLSKVTVQPINLQAKTATPSTQVQTIEADDGYSGLSSVEIAANPIVTYQTKTVQPTVESQTVEADTGYDALESVVVNGIRLQEKIVTPSTINQDVTPDLGKDGLSSVRVTAIETQAKQAVPRQISQSITPDYGKYLTSVEITAAALQDKNVTPSGSEQVIEPDDGYYGLGSVTVSASSEYRSQTKSVSPSTTSQTVTPDSGYDGLSSVSVGGAALQTLNAQLLDTAQSLHPDSGYYGFDEVNIPALPQYRFQDKAVTPTSESQLVLADEGYNALSSVTVGAAAQPTLTTKTITENGTYDAEDDNADGYSSVTVNVPSSGGIDLLWTNQNISLDFDAQTVSLDLTDYENVIIWGMSNRYYGDRYVNRYVVSSLAKGTEFYATRAIITKGDTGYMNFGGIAGTNAQNYALYARQITVSDTGVVFGQGQVNISNTLSWQNNNQYAIPYKIYGVKGSLPTT